MSREQWPQAASQHQPTAYGQPSRHPQYSSSAPPPHAPYDPRMQQAAQEQSNLLLNAASSLLTLIVQIRRTKTHANVPSLRAMVIEEIKNFERKASESGYPVRTIMAARYCLCTAVDEAVLNTPWGTQSIWVQESLLSLFQKETYGGERFYLILQDMLSNTRQNIDFVELVYFLLSLGFEGKFFGPESRAAREGIRNKVFYQIRHSRNKPERVLARHWRLANLPNLTDKKKSKLKRYMLAALIVIVILLSYFNIQTFEASKQVNPQLEKIGTVYPVTVFSQVIGRPVVPRKNGSSS